jgi:hypothetical protein
MAALLALALALEVVAGVLVPGPLRAAAVREVFVEKRHPVYPDDRRKALEQVLLRAAGMAPDSGSPARLARAEAAVRYVDVLSETVSPDYYAIRARVGLEGEDDTTTAGDVAPEVPGDGERADEGGPPPTVHVRGPGDTRPVTTRPVVTRLVVHVPLGVPGALNAFHSMLRGLDVRGLDIRPNPALLLDARVDVAGRAIVLPVAPAGSGITIIEDGP